MQKASFLLLTVTMLMLQGVLSMVTVPFIDGGSAGTSPSANDPCPSNDWP